VLRVAAQGLDVVIVNPSGIIGPHDYKPSMVGMCLFVFHISLSVCVCVHTCHMQAKLFSILLAVACVHTSAAPSTLFR
jgi:hypothetical protein